MDINKLYDEKFVKTSVLEIVRQMYDAEFKPDYIAAMNRGGLIAGVMLSHYLHIPLKVLHRDESNLWMAEEAYGYVPKDMDPVLTNAGGHDPAFAKNILIIDDINDTGSTFKELVDDWQGGCLPKNDHWNDVWHNNVKFAVLIHNEASDFDSDFVGKYINKVENPEWCVFPWESWW